MLGEGGWASEVFAQRKYDRKRRGSLMKQVRGALRCKKKPTLKEARKQKANFSSASRLSSKNVLAAAGATPWLRFALPPGGSSNAE